MLTRKQHINVCTHTSLSEFSKQAQLSGERFDLIIQLSAPLNRPASFAFPAPYQLEASWEHPSKVWYHHNLHSRPHC
jgi:hypothetical protein